MNTPLRYARLSNVNRTAIEVPKPSNMKGRDSNVSLSLCFISAKNSSRKFFFTNRYFITVTMSKTKKHIEKINDIFSLNAREKLSEPTAAVHIASMIFLPLNSNTIGSNMTMSKPATYVTTDFQWDSTNR